MVFKKTNQKRLLIVGASMPLPTDELRYEDTWPYLIRKYFPNVEIINKSARARSVTSLTSEGGNLLECYSPDIIILHLGLTDCAPRLLPRRKLYVKIIKRTFLAKIIFKYLRRTKGRQIIYADVNPHDFFFHIDSYVKRAGKIPIGIVKLSKVIGKASQSSPHFNESINIYNCIFERIAKENENVTIIDGLDGSTVEDYQSDGFHLRAKGQTKIFSHIVDFLHITCG